MDDSKQLVEAVKWRAKRRTGRAVRLGQALGGLVEKQIGPKQAKVAAVIEVWNQLLPEELRRHCRIIGISGENLKVLVDSPSHMYELQLCRGELLEELQQQCRHSKIRKIKFVLG